MQYVRKNAANNGYEWASLVNEFPAGGTALQYVRKNAANNAYEWATLVDDFPAGGVSYQGVRLAADGTTREWAALLNVINRQGGNATNWNTPGTTTRAVTKAVCQAGSVSITMTGGGPASGTAAITFPTAFSNVPLIFLSISASQSSGVWAQLEFYNLTASGMTIWIGQNANDSNYNPRTVHWFAIGPI